MDKETTYLVLGLAALYLLTRRQSTPAYAAMPTREPSDVDQVIGTLDDIIGAVSGAFGKYQDAEAARARVEYERLRQQNADGAPTRSAEAPTSSSSSGSDYQLKLSGWAA